MSNSTASSVAPNPVTSPLRIGIRRVHLHKKVPLAIARGVSTGSDNLFVTVEQGAHRGIGECAPGVAPATEERDLLTRAEHGLHSFAEQMGGMAIRDIHAAGMQARIPAPALAALDCALWDLRAKQASMTLYDLLGLSLPTVPTSVTVGLSAPEQSRKRTRTLLEQTGAKALKVKLGSPDGLAHDKAHFDAVRAAAAPFGVPLRVDANGGWSLRDAQSMLTWLATRDVAYVEQPLSPDADEDLVPLYRHRALPIFIDESCRVARDVPRLAGRVDGVNLKLMKCGGITGALDIIATARASNLSVMIGCMGESSIGIAAAAALTSAVDFIDLDAHLNLDPDPAAGSLLWEDGVVMPKARAGHGGRLRA
ncbi:MAG: dipeptide epimerase [Polyangiales bacterium]